MKSNKQRRAEIRTRRLERAARIEAQMRVPDQRRVPLQRAPGLEPADLDVLARHNNTHGPLPACYLDRAFTCRDCGAEGVWTAKQQKWWYEVMHGKIDSRAVRCLPCRRARRAAQAASREGGGANRLGELSERLRALARTPATPEARAEAVAALDSKWWGLRRLAIAALGAWGGSEDVARLRAMVDAHQPLRGRWAHLAAGHAAEALAANLCHPRDDAWVIEACLAGRASPWTWRRFLGGLPDERIKACAKAEFAREPHDADRLQRVLVLMHAAGHPFIH